MCRFVSHVFIILCLDLVRVIDSASIPWGTRTSPRSQTKMLKELSYQVNPREMIEFAFDVNKAEAYKKFHEAYNRNRDSSAKLSLLEAEIELDELSSATSQTMCKKPLPKVVNMYGILELDKNVILSPAGIAVSKCGQESGCCPPGEECVASEFRTKNFTYLHIEQQELTIRSHEVLEDARCTCRQIKNELDPSQISGQSSSILTVCDENEEYDDTTGMCQCSRSIFCASGMVLNADLCQCEEVTENVDETECPLGKTFDVVNGRCECSVPCPTETIIDPFTCACEDARNTPSTNGCWFTKCPKPFHINETACTCDCDEEDRNCDKMRTGKKELNEKHCSNVRLGTYGEPSCTQGRYFNLIECKCKRSSSR